MGMKPETTGVPDLRRPLPPASLSNTISGLLALATYLAATVALFYAAEWALRWIVEALS